VKPGSHRCGSRPPAGPPPETRMPWGEDHLRWRPARRPRAGRHPRPDRHGSVAALEWHQGELYPRVGFIVTNLKSPAERVVKFYNGRGTAEQWIREGKAALRKTRLSCRVFRANAVRLQLFALACDLANFLRTLALPDAVAQWSLTTLREKLVKVGARLVRHGRYVDLSAGRGGGAAGAVRRDPASHRPAARPARGGLAGANYGASSAEGRTMRQRSAKPVGEPGAPSTRKTEAIRGNSG
jgi:Transposase DDE domain group 1